MQTPNFTNCLRRAGSVAGLTLLVGALASAAWQSLQWGDADHKKMGKALAKLAAEKTSDKDIEKARAEILGDLEKLGRKAGAKTDEAAVELALAAHSDIGKALAYSKEFSRTLKPGKVEARKSQFRETTTDYALSLPAAYKPTNAPIPLILCVPGLKDGKPTDPQRFLQDQLQDTAVREGAAIVAVAMPGGTANWVELGSDASPGGLFALMSVYRDVTKAAAVAPDKIFVLGREQGAAAAMALGARFPHLFAGVAVMAADIEPLSVANFCNLSTLLQGGANSSAFEAQIKEAGYNNCTIKADATVADLWTWITQTARATNPAKVVIEPGVARISNAYWLKFPAVDGMQGKVSATADRSSNTIKIDCPADVASITVSLNDALADLSKPITFVINGREQTHKVVRNLVDMLDFIQRGASDGTRVYVTKILLDVPR